MSAPLSAVGQQQRAELKTAVLSAIEDVAARGMTFRECAEAVIALLEARGLTRFQSANCPECGRDREEAERGRCAMGGCPCGGDL